MPLNVRWVPDKHFSIYDMNVWFYDGCMPEYATHNHEKLAKAGETLGETATVIGREFLRIGSLALVGALMLYYLSGTAVPTANTGRSLRVR